MFAVERLLEVAAHGVVTLPAAALARGGEVAVVAAGAVELSVQVRLLNARRE